MRICCQRRTRHSGPKDSRHCSSSRLRSFPKPVESLNADPVVAEIHEVRRRLLEASGGDIAKFRQGLLERQSAAGRRIVSGALKKQTEPSDAIDSRAAS